MPFMLSLLFLVFAQDRVAEAVERLQSDDIEVRDRAMQELIAIGEPARIEMIRLSKSDEIELRGRALEVIQAWGPTLALVVGPLVQKCSGTTAEVTLVNTGPEPVRIPWPNHHVHKVVWETKTLAPGESLPIRNALFLEQDGVVTVTWSPLPVRRPILAKKVQKACLDRDELDVIPSFGSDVFTGTLKAARKVEK